ncbi:MAG: IS66 family transposase [Planctomycetota bacterium]
MKTEAAELPNDPEALSALVAKLQAENLALRQENRTLEEKALRFQALYFGKGSEKTRPTTDSEEWKQVPLFQAELLAEAKAAAEANNVSGTIASEPGKPRRKGGRRSKYPAHLPQVETKYELEGEQKACSCGHEMHFVGFETSKELERIETTIVHTIKRAKYACRGCGESMKTVPGPFRPFEGALLGTGFTATMLNERFGHHMPFNRLESKYRGEGLELSRSTLERTAARAAKRLAPLVDLLKEKIKASEVLFTDDTPVTIARVPGSTTGSKKGRMWVYVDRVGNHAFDFTRDRKNEHPENWLDGFKGAMHADAYSGYDTIFESGEVTEIGCWAHARRYFKDAEDFDPDITAEILSRIRDLFAVESAAKEAELNDDARRDFRQERARPVLRDLRALLDKHEISVLPKSTLGKAIRYALNQWTALTAYVDDGRCEIENNTAERALRPIAAGRKGWMFFLNEGGGENAAVIFSLIETAKAAGVNPVDYLRDVLVRMDFERDWEKLLPHRWREEFAQEVQQRREAAMRELSIVR